VKKTGQRKVECIVDIHCDACGTSVVPDEQKNYRDTINGFDEYAVLRAAFGYGSNRDGDEESYDLCESCFSELVVKLKEMKARNGVKQKKLKKH